MAKGIIMEERIDFSTLERRTPQWEPEVSYYKSRTSPEVYSVYRTYMPIGEQPCLVQFCRSWGNEQIKRYVSMFPSQAECIEKFKTQREQEWIQLSEDELIGEIGADYEEVKKWAFLERQPTPTDHCASFSDIMRETRFDITAEAAKQELGFVVAETLSLDTQMLTTLLSEYLANAGGYDNSEQFSLLMTGVINAAASLKPGIEWAVKKGLLDLTNKEIVNP